MQEFFSRPDAICRSFEKKFTKLLHKLLHDKRRHNAKNWHFAGVAGVFFAIKSLYTILGAEKKKKKIHPNNWKIFPATPAEFTQTPSLNRVITPFYHPKNTQVPRIKTPANPLKTPAKFYKTPAELTPTLSHWWLRPVPNFS